MPLTTTIQLSDLHIPGRFVARIRKLSGNGYYTLEIPVMNNGVPRFELPEHLYDMLNEDFEKDMEARNDDA